MKEPRMDTTPTGARGPGTPVAFEETYLRFAPLLRTIAVKKFGIPAADAEPLVHDVFSTYLTHTENVEQPEKYFIGSLCNAARNYLRPGAANELFCGEEPCAATPTEAILREVERKMLISRRLARAGSRCRDILHRYYINGETTDAIAGELGLKPSTVLIFLIRCRERVLSGGPTGTALC
jgi:RNA polymerase sigma factor (sigma-70 family)